MSDVDAVDAIDTAPARSLVTAEAELVEMLLLQAFYDEVQAGRRVEAEAQARAWIDRAVAAGLPVRVEGGRWFDAVHTLNSIRSRGLAGADDLWGAHVVASKQRHARALLDEPTSEVLHDPRRITLRVRREVAQARPGSRVMISLPLPSEEPTQRQIVVEPATPPTGARITREPRALVLRALVPDDGVVAIEATISFLGARTTHRLDGPSSWPERTPTLEPWLAREEGLLRLTPAIDALAASLRREDPVATIASFWGFVFERMIGGGVAYDRLGTDDPIAVAVRGRWFDCLVGCTLLAALCRSVGIPARLVHGTLLWPTDKGPHYWLEAYLPPHGWVPFDLHAWHLAGGVDDGVWSRALFGRLPHQLVLTRLPRAERELGIRFPATWYQTARLDGDRATMLTIHDATDGAWTYRDRVELLDAKGH